MGLFENKKESNTKGSFSPSPQMNNPPFKEEMHQGGNLFKETDAKIGMRQISQLAERLDTLESKLRLIENKLSLSSQKESSLESNFIEFKKDTLKRISEIQTEISKIKDTLEEWNEKLKQMISEIKMKGNKAEIDAIKKYLEYWRPVEFTTRETVRKMIKKALEESLEEREPQH